MKHIKITELDNGLKRLVPDDGYILYNTITLQYYSIAEVKNIKPYIAVKLSDLI